MSSLTPLVAAHAAACTGTVILPTASIQAAVTAAGKNTAFCLSPGTYVQTATISPKDGDSFTGTGLTRDDTIVKTTTVQLIFNQSGVDGVSFTHFAITGAFNRCPGSNCGATAEGSRVAQTSMWKTCTSTATV